MHKYTGLPLHSAATATGNGVAFPVTRDTNGPYSTVSFQITGTFTATVTFEGTLGRSTTQGDNTWVAIPAENVTTGAVSTTATAAGVYRVNATGLAYVRARVTWSSGTSITVVALGVPESIDNPGLSSATLPSSIQGPGNPVIDSYTSAKIDLAASTTNQVLVSSAASKQIWVYGLFMMADTAAGTVQLEDEDDTELTGTMAVSDEGGWVLPLSGNFSMPWIKLGTDKDLEADTGACTIDGIICYAIVSV